MESGTGHFDELIGNEKFHFQLAGSELNRDAIIFSTALAKILRLNTIEYRKCVYPGEAPYIISEHVDFGRMKQGNKVINSYNLEEIKGQLEADFGKNGDAIFSQFCAMLVLDVFTLNCDRTHNNWLLDGEDILIYDYNFTFGTALLLHGVTDLGLKRMLSTGISQRLDESLISQKNSFLYNRFAGHGKLDICDLVDYTVQKANKDPACTRIGDDPIALLPCGIRLISYLAENRIAAELIDRVAALSGDEIAAAIPSDSSITMPGNSKYLSLIFGLIKEAVGIA
jgi:hypothetical protein